MAEGCHGGARQFSVRHRESAEVELVDEVQRKFLFANKAPCASN